METEEKVTVVFMDSKESVAMGNAIIAGFVAGLSDSKLGDDADV